MEKVSIIIPVYKAEKYLTRCVESVLSQTYENIELILVDDGSPDNCPRLCDELAEKDSRIKVIHKANGGASSARNCGLDNADGQLICFVDSDDAIPADSVELLRNVLVHNNADYVAGICLVAETGKPKNNIKADFVIDFDEQSEKLLRYITGSGSYSPYAKIFSADIINEYNIRYDEELKCSEDALFIRTYLSHCKRMAFVSKPVYEYTAFNASSLSKKGYVNYCEYYVKKMFALEELCQHLNLADNFKKQFLFERALHGLKISINHYLNNWENEEDRNKLISRSVDLLGRWLFTYNYDQSPFSVNVDLIHWWNKNKELLTNGSYSQFCKKQIASYNKAKKIERIKNFIKRILR